MKLKSREPEIERLREHIDKVLDRVDGRMRRKVCYLLMTKANKLKNQERRDREFEGG